MSHPLMQDLATQVFGTKIHLSPVEKDRMWAYYLRGGFTYNDLAVRYGVSLQTVGRTLRGESN